MIISDPEVLCRDADLRPRDIYRGPRYYLGVQDNYVGPRDTLEYYLGVRHSTSGLGVRGNHVGV